MSDDWPDGVVVARIEIRRTLTGEDGEGGDIISSHSDDGQGGSISLLETLGLLEFSKDSAIRESMGEDE